MSGPYFPTADTSRDAHRKSSVGRTVEELCTMLVERVQREAGTSMEQSAEEYGRIGANGLWAVLAWYIPTDEKNAPAQPS